MANGETPTEQPSRRPGPRRPRKPVDPEELAALFERALARPVVPPDACRRLAAVARKARTEPG